MHIQLPKEPDEHPLQGPKSQPCPCLRLTDKPQQAGIGVSDSDWEQRYHELTIQLSREKGK